MNPARAGLLDKQNPNLKLYKWSSYPYYLKPPAKRPGWLHVKKVFKGQDIGKDNKNALKILKFHESDLEKTKKNDPQKQVIAWLVKTRTMVQNQWVANRLLMGDPSSIGHAVQTVKETKNGHIRSMKKKLEKYLYDSHHKNSVFRD